MAPAHPHATGVAVYPALFEEGLPDIRAIRIDIFHDLGAFTSIDKCHICIAHILKNGWNVNTAF